ncbi:DUF2304 domain-containing protein [Aeromicrobium wangtongii]|uniref:DUF2304 domain-containing protein n=1 Tax=Aeromicrobium wangtongii TaxID=2969247 RepID=UPI002016D86A|nr:DUF2304 domain-containing protein [Aeromicrobium wangtongii]MCL3817334.1 DUF2304 domain-containing protein [Aeromicrobium wangtongii]
MHTGQIVIKILLIAAFVLFALIIIIPSKGSRHLAVRRLALLAVLALGILTVIFPDITSRLAEAVGVARGTDLVLYALVVVFVGNSIFTAAKFRHHERDITQLARRLALAEAPRPTSSAADGH